ncbi:MAG: Ig-like domain-containing protein, partial [Clostridiales Family XIII bacterium]|nr:Ig-like domain-containing protein [Clostridiales Family XIII bacterium]
QTDTDPDTWESLTLDTDYAVTLSGNPDNSTDTGTITLQNDWLTTLAAGDYHLRVSYKPMGETYVPATNTGGVSSQDGNEAPQTTAYTLTVSKNAQSIAIADPYPENTTALTYGTAPVELALSITGAGSGAVTWSKTFAGDDAVATVANSGTVTDGGILTILSAMPDEDGYVTVQASKAADDDYLSAVGTYNIYVKKAVPAVTLTPSGGAGGSAVTLSAAVAKAGTGDVPTGNIRFYEVTSGGDVPIGEAAALTAGTGDDLGKGVCSINAGVLPGGEHSFKAVYSGMTDKYTAAEDTAEGYNAEQASQTIRVDDPGTLTFGDTGVTLSVTESDPHGTGAVTWSAPANSAFTLDEDTGALTIIGTGRAVVTAMKAADDYYTAASDTLELTVKADKKGFAAVIRAANDDTATPDFDLAAETEPPYYEDNYAAGAWEDLIETYAKAAAVFDDESAAQEEAVVAAEALSAALAALGEQDHPVIGYDGIALAEPSKNFEASIGEFGRRIQIEFKGHVGTVAGLRINGAEYRIAGRSDFVHSDTAAGFAAYDVFDAEGVRVGTITEGSAIVTLDSAFADRLANGAHNLEILFADPQNTGSGAIAIKVYRTGNNTGNDGGNDSNNGGNNGGNDAGNDGNNGGNGSNSAGNGAAVNTPIAPATGDSFDLSLWFALAALAVILSISLRKRVIIQKNKGGSRDE